MAGLSVMNEKTTGNANYTPRSESVNGYFAARFARGESPAYGYPSNHMPEVNDVTMIVVTGFMAAKKMDK